MNHKRDLIRMRCSRLQVQRAALRPALTHGTVAPAAAGEHDELAAVLPLAGQRASGWEVDLVGDRRDLLQIAFRAMGEERDSCE